jgi:HPt (histidine-containing phosphotransfer) domain-containing protein
LSKPIERDELITTIANLLALETTALRAASGMAETKVTSNLPEAIVRLRPAFLANRRADILQLRESLQEGNFAAIRTIGHNCKGVGKNYGFPEITTVGAELEAAAIARDTNLTSSIIEKFASVVHTARE